ncbi:hypothetical protein, partial [Dokdonella sp.]|uniref:hypothetical protein n=1 Tax=Dokdonella sp. TaxID=2291710 RepID=UPI002F3E5F56
MKLVSRTLHVKRVTYRGRGNREASDLPTLDEMIKGIFAKGDTVGKRHYPAADNLKPGKPCVCFDDYVDSGVGARFKMYSYVHAHTPDQVVPDLNAKHVNLVTEPLETADGKQKAVAIMCQVIVLGETMIVEYASGSGGVAAVVSALAYLSKKVDRRIAHMKAQNIPSRALTQMIKENGGVREVRATLRGTVPIESRFGMTLSTVRKGMGNATR